MHNLITTDKSNLQLENKLPMIEVRLTALAKPLILTNPLQGMVLTYIDVTVQG